MPRLLIIMDAMGDYHLMLLNILNTIDSLLKRITHTMLRIENVLILLGLVLARLMVVLISQLMMKRVLNKLLEHTDLFLLPLKLLMGSKTTEVVYIPVMFVRMDQKMSIMLLLLLVMVLKMEWIIILLRILGVNNGVITDTSKSKEEITCVVWHNAILSQISDKSKLLISYRKIKRFNLLFYIN